MSSNAQHNIAAIQLQLQVMQQENATLTKDLCLKENYLQLKDQQCRVMQKRMEELESAVATWKDKYLQQINSQNSTSSTSSGPTMDDLPLVRDGDSTFPTLTKDSLDSDKGWVPWSYKMGSLQSSSKNLQQAMALIDKLSLVDREKLKPMLAAINSSATITNDKWEEVFSDVSEDLSKILLLYLLPVVMEKQQVSGATIHCFSRTYTKQTMDFKIVKTTPKQQVPSPVTVISPPPSLPSPGQTAISAYTAPPSPAFSSSELTSPRQLSEAIQRPPSYMRTLSQSATANSPQLLQSPMLGAIPQSPATPNLGSTTGSTTTTTYDEAPHLFDCIDCDKRNAVPVPHGLRELHPTKAVYISKPSNNNGPGSGNGGNTNDKASRRYTFVSGSRSQSSATMDLSRTLTFNPLSSPSTAPTDSHNDSITPGDRRSGAAAYGSSSSHPHKDGKIKKIVGSVMDRLNRHKISATANSNLEEDESICDGCGRGPLVGVKWVCRTCRVMDDQEYELCDKCYGQGVHGKENEEALFQRIEEIVVLKCPRLSSEKELMGLLRVGICKGNLKKFSFCLTWIADLLQCKQTTDLRARALEISQISPQVRSDFVMLLTDLLDRYRRDIELITEWGPAPSSGSSGPGALENKIFGGSQQLDTLRIWVKDANKDGNDALQ